jgi:hypothetical protein
MSQASKWTNILLINLTLESLTVAELDLRKPAIKQSEQINLCDQSDQSDQLGQSYRSVQL